MSGLTDRRLRPAHATSRQRGAASLVVVMVLFFIVSLVAAYTNRSLIFEQRTASNQYRSTQALEAAEAGIEWALAMLNSGRITNSCAPSTTATDASFRQRYLTIDPATGVLNRVVRPDGLGPLWPSCVFDGTDWVCSCHSDGAPVQAAPAGTAVYPAFRVQFTALGGARPGVIRIQSNGCTRLNDACLSFPSSAAPGEGRATVQALVALRNGLAAPPVAALTVRGDMDVGAASMGLFNTGLGGTGITALIGGNMLSTALRLHTHPGSPADLSVIDTDAQLSALGADRMFSSTFATPRDVYQKQPGAVILPCVAGTCTAAQVRAAVSAYPERIVWIAGDLNLDSAGDIGSALEPVALVVQGSIRFVTPSTVFGLVYSQANDWSSFGAGQIRGAAIAEGSFTGSTTADIIFDADIINRVHRTTGTYVRVPGSWRDF